MSDVEDTAMMFLQTAAQLEIERLKIDNELLRKTLRSLVDNVLDYERVNNLSPNPGRKYCWDTVANAVKILDEQ